MTGIAYYDVALDQAADLFIGLRDRLPDICAVMKPALKLIDALRPRPGINRANLPAIATAPRRKVIKLYGPEIAFDPNIDAGGGHAETGRKLWGIGIQLDSGWHMTCISPEGRHPQILPTHWSPLHHEKVAA